jgi:thiol peroxidase
MAAKKRAKKSPKKTGKKSTKVPAAKKKRATTKKSRRKKASKKVTGKSRSAARTGGTRIALGGNPVHTVGSLPRVGSKLPAFTLTTADLQDITNKDFSGKRIIFNIYPSIDTNTCAASTRTFNSLAGNLRNTEVWCISADLPFAQKRFCGAEGLDNVKTASTFRSDFGKTFGVTLRDSVLKGVLARAIVVADERGKVLHTEMVSEIAQEPNYEAAVKSLG